MFNDSLDLPAVEGLPQGQAAVFEPLEGRILLSGQAPIFATDIPDKFVITPAGGGLAIGVDGFDADGDALSITATSSSTKITVTRPAITRYARLHFTKTDGTTPIVGDGDIVVALFDGLSKTASDRFVKLATRHVLPNGRTTTSGTPYYTDVLVHRIIDYFMIQTGDAENGDGTGGSPLGAYKDSIDPLLSFAGRGVLAMANSGADTNDSQFFLTDAPTTWLNQQHMIFGQIISGWNVLQSLSETPVNGDAKPWDNVYLDHVEIFQSKQDTAFVFSAASDFAGEAQVTITLNDGHENIVSKVITLKKSGEVTDSATVTVPSSSLTVRPGQTGTIQPTINGATHAWLHVYDDAGAQVTMNPTTYQITVTLPEGYPHAQFTVRVAVESVGADYDNVMPNTATFDVWVTGDSPDIDVPTTQMNVFPGQTYTFTPTITDEIGAALDVTVAPVDPAFASLVSMDPVTRLVTITIPQDFAFYRFPVMITAKETGFDHAKPGESTFYVQPAGNAPAISNVTAPIFLRPGQTYRFTPTITDDGPRTLVLTAKASRSDVLVAQDPVTREVMIVTPTNFSGMFQVTLTAAEDGFQDRVPTSKTFYVFSQNAYDPPALGRVNTSDTGQAMGTCLLGNYLYVANGSNGLAIYDVSDPASPALRSTQSTYGDAWDVQVVNTTISGSPATIAFVSSLSYGVTVFDVTNLSSIRRITTLSTDYATVAVHVQGNLLFQCDWGYYPEGGQATPAKLKVYDISNPNSIVLKDTVTTIMGGYSVQYAVACSGAGNYAYLLDAMGYMFVLDVSNPADVKYVTYVQTGGNAWDIEVQNGTAYIIDQFSGLIAVDVHDPEAPALLGVGKVPSMAWAKLAVSGNVAVTSLDTGFLMTDISDPAKMASQYTFTGTSYGGDPSFLNGRLALPFGVGGVAVLNADSLIRSMKVDKTRTFNFANGRTVTMTVSGPGGVRVYLDAADPQVIDLLEIIGSTAKTSVTVTSRNGDAVVDDITISGDLNALTARTTDLRANLTAHGKVRSITLDDVADGHVITINSDNTAVGPRDSLTLTFDRVADTAIDTHGVPIASLTATEWLNTTGAAEAIVAPWIGRITTRGAKGAQSSPGDFTASLNLAGTGVAAGAKVLGTVSIAGRIGAGTWTVGGNVASITGDYTDPLWVLNADGAVGSLEAKAANEALAGTLLADYYGRVTARGSLAAAFTAYASDPRLHTSINSLSAGVVHDVSLDVPGGIGSITVIEWTNTDGIADRIAAAWIGTLRTTGQRLIEALNLPYLPGDFEANLVLDGEGLTSGPVLRSASIAGNILGENETILWDLTGAAGTVTIGGNVDKWHGQADAATSFKAASVGNAELLLDGALGSLTAFCWDAGRVRANTVGSVNITGRAGRAGIDPVDGNFSAALDIQGQDVLPKRTALGSVRIAKNLSGGTILVRSGAMGALTVGGTALNSVLRCAKSIGKITLGATSGSDFLAGVTADKAPADLLAADLDATATIASVTVTGLAGPGVDPTGRFVTDADFVAGRIGAVSLKNPAAGPVPYRFYVPAVQSLKSVRQQDAADPKDAGLNWTWLPSQPNYPACWVGSLPIHTLP